MCALVAAAFFVGYWTIGNGFAHSDALGYLALAGVLACVAGAMTVAWLFRRRRWPGGGVGGQGSLAGPALAQDVPAAQHHHERSQQREHEWLPVLEIAGDDVSHA